MSTALFVAVAIIAAAACPLHMWWQQRRGRRAICCPPSRSQVPDDLETLRARQEDLGRRVASLSAPAPAESQGRRAR